jgi:hypothetical protein
MVTAVGIQRIAHDGLGSMVGRLVAGTLQTSTVHFHCIIPDGVFVRENGSVRFVALAPPSDDDVMAVLRRIVARLDDLLRPRLASAEADARPLDALGAAQAEAMNSLGTAPPDTREIQECTAVHLRTGAIRAWHPR